MRFCFIVESKYRNESMPIVVAHQLVDWGHDVDLLEPQTSIIYLSDVMRAGYDAYVLKSDVEVEKHRIPVSLELRNLAPYVGNVFGLDIYGLDVVENPNGPMVVDINDFPSFGYVPGAAILVAAHIIEVASHRVARHLSDVPTVRLTGIPDEIAIPA